MAQYSYVREYGTFVCRVQSCFESYYYVHPLVVVPRDVSTD